MKKSIIVLLIVAFTAGVSLVSPVETEATCLICCTGCVIGYAVCITTCQSDKEECELWCGMLLKGCQQECPCCDGCPGS
jgi:hypothetical protein